MSMTYSDLQNEVLRRSVREQGGTQFTTAIKNVINSSLFRVAREALWKPLRRKATFDTITTYSTGTGAGTFTNNSKSVTITGATFLTDNIAVGRRFKPSGSTTNYIIATITGEETLTLDRVYDGTTTSTGTYSILAQEEYNLPIQANTRCFLWHEEYGCPYKLQYLTDQSFYSNGMDTTTESTVLAYRMWGENNVIEQPKAASVVTIVSSSTSDTSVDITVFGTVSGYPDYEVINSNGTTPVNGTKSFTSIDRIAKGQPSIGRITCTTDSAVTTTAVFPVGDTTSGIKYSKVQLYPLPSAVHPIHVQYYKEPYRLVNDTDIHEFGQDFDEAIILLSVAKINVENNKDEGTDFFQLYQDEIRSLKKTNVDKIDWFPKLGRGVQSIGSGSVHPILSYQQIGPNYGPGSRY